MSHKWRCTIACLSSSVPCHLHPCACHSTVTRSSQSGTTCLWVGSSLQIPLWRQMTPWSLTLQRYSRVTGGGTTVTGGGVGGWDHSHRRWSGWVGPQSQGVEGVGGTTVTGGGVGWRDHSHRGWSGLAGPQSQGVEWVGRAEPNLQYCTNSRCGVWGVGMSCSVRMVVNVAA